MSDELVRKLLFTALQLPLVAAGVALIFWLRAGPFARPLVRLSAVVVALFAGFLLGAAPDYGGADIQEGLNHLAGAVCGALVAGFLAFFGAGAVLKSGVSPTRVALISGGVWVAAVGFMTFRFY